MEALADRAAIDWSALRARMQSRDAGDLIDSLRTVDTIRRQSIRVSGAHNAHPLAAIAAAAIAIVAGIQTALGLTFMAMSPSSAAAAAVYPTQLALALAFSAASVLLAVSAARDPRQTFLLAIFLCIASTFVRGALLKHPPHVLIDILTIPSLKAFIPACAWQFALDFPRVPRFTRFDVWGRRATAIAWGLGAIALTLDALGVFALENTVFWRVFSVSLLPVACAIAIRSRRAPYPERRKVARLASALVLGALPFLVQGFARTVAPDFNAWLVTAHPRERLWLDLLVIGGLLALPGLSSLAVIVDRPFEVRAKWWRWSRARSLSAQRLARAVERMAIACGPRETAFVIDRELRSGIGATRTRVMTPDVHGRFIDATDQVAPIEVNTALRALVSQDTAVNLARGGPIFDLLPAGDRDWAASNDVELIALLRRRNGDLAALVAIGPQRGGEPYTADDLTFVTALAAASGLAWDADRTVERTPLAQPAYECERCGELHDAADALCSCGGTLALASLPRRLTSKFVVERRIGRGGAGVVYLAHDITIGRAVALKTLPTLRRGVKTRLADEARTMASLRHEGLATIYGLEVWRQVPILVVEYFAAGTLARRLAHGPLSLDDTIQFGIALADTLSYLHGCGLLHRDLKPSNIAISSTGAPVLLDFGLATWIEPTMDTGGIVGTSAYLPPEAFARRPASPVFDLWALAIVLRECLSGQQPYSAEDLRRRAPLMASLLERALATDVSCRFRTATEFRYALEHAQ